ncbi:MAG: peptidyl-prolyl cis-trans isomerase [Coriobacteriia bacterium]|nr:peptidyl-prolyl cis-trans isomerase [Coriobacteriia bacterium]
MKRIRGLATALLAAALAFSMVGCDKIKVQQGIAASVNGEKITIEELDKQLAQYKEQYPQLFQGKDAEQRELEYRRRLLDNLIDQVLVRQAAKDKGVDITDEKVAQQIDQLKAGFENEKKFLEALESANMSEESLKKQISEQMVTQGIIESLEVNTTVSDKEISEYYEKNKAQFVTKNTKRASHILLKAEDEALAKDVLAQAQKKNADFAELAKKYSTDTSNKDKGGDLDYPTTPYVAEFQAALDKLQVGEMSDLVKTQFGWHIVKVTEERPGGQQPLEEVKDRIAQIITQQRRSESYRKYLQELRDKATIVIYIEELKPEAEQKKPAEGSKETTPAKSE